MTKNLSIFLSINENSYKFHEFAKKNKLTCQCQQKASLDFSKRFKLEPQKNSNVCHTISDLSTRTKLEKGLFSFAATKLTFKLA